MINLILTVLVETAPVPSHRVKRHPQCSRWRWTFCSDAAENTIQHL